MAQVWKDLISSTEASVTHFLQGNSRSFENQQNKQLEIDDFATFGEVGCVLQGGVAQVLLLFWIENLENLATI